MNLILAIAAASLLVALQGCDQTGSLDAIGKAAEQGNADAQFNLGRMYDNGEGVPKDAAKAVEWYRKAAEQGNADAQNNLGLMYYNGEGVPKDAAKAVEWYRKAAEQGTATAQFNLGWMYRDGEGVPKDAAKAVEWYRKAAEQGDANAQVNLGLMYDNGEGVPKDAAKAVEWYRKAAEQGTATAQTNLGAMYQTGEGVPKDAAKAVEWYRKAAEQGDAYAQVMLGWMYDNGEGVGRDPVLAYAWMNLASAKESDFAKWRDGIKLSREQRAEAERLSSNWKPGHTIARAGKSSDDRNAAADGAPAKAGSGTAFMVSKSGHAVTNHHLIADCAIIKAQGHDGVVEVLTSDSINDLALLQIRGDTKASATLNDAPDKLRQGEEVIVFGFPLNAVLSSGGNLTPGVVSALTGLGNNTNQMQITAAIQPGSSGSPVLNKKGEVVGVVSIKLSDTKMSQVTGQIGQNVNFAVNGVTLNAFLHAHNVDYRTGGFLSFGKNTADLADEARRWTFVVECWK